MIILITGASHTGKTILSQRMLEKYKYPYLSIDHLKMGLIRSGNTNLTPMDDEELTKYLWPIVSEMRMICLAMTDEYIKSNFANIINHGSDIESRLDDSNCNVNWLKEENHIFINGFKDDFENIILINDDYENTIKSILDN